MNPALERMMASYHCQTEDDYCNAVREIMQEIALQGLWRSNFFEHAAFYGGTALRILYGLDRGSEDMDFSLLAPQPSFRIADYGDFLQKELESFGLTVEWITKKKTAVSAIDSAFLKANTKTELLAVGMPAEMAFSIPNRQQIKIKLEVDTDPPAGFQTEIKTLFRPTPHSVRVYSLPDLLAGKMHAVLCRSWWNRIKGRDWYDLVWYAGNAPVVHLAHLEQRMRQSGDYPLPKKIYGEGEEVSEAPLGRYSENEHLTLDHLKRLLLDAIDRLDIEAARQDVRPFLGNPQSLDLWSKSFFADAVRCFSAK